MSPRVAEQNIGQVAEYTRETLCVCVVARGVVQETRVHDIYMAGL